MDFTNIPQRPSYDVLHQLSWRARASKNPRTRIIDASMTARQRCDQPWLTLTEHYKRSGWTGDPGQHAEVLKRDGWIRMVQGGRTLWAMSSAARWWWLSPRFLFDRCPRCVATDRYDCDHVALNDLTPGKTLYVLALEGGFFYVGTSETPLNRFEEHCGGAHAAEWTSLHRPLRIDRAWAVPDETFFRDETAETERMMRIHGMSQVQGGTYVGEHRQWLAMNTLERAAEPRDAGSSPILLTFKDLHQALGDAT